MRIMNRLVSVSIAALVLAASAVQATTVFTTQPKSQSTVVGGKATFTVVATPGDYTLQWFKIVNSSPVLIPGATNSSYTISNAQTSDACAYYCRGPLAGMDMFSSDDTSTIVSLTIDQMPTFDSNSPLLSRTNVAVGATNIWIDTWAYGADIVATWTVGSQVVSGGGPNGDNPFACVVDTSHAGVFNYVITVTNLAGAIHATSVVTVVSAPVISVNLTNKTLAVGSNYTFKVVATNLSGTYTWYRGTSLLTGSTNTYAITGAQYSDVGTYTVVLSNLAQCVTSAPAVLTVLKVPSITNQPTPTNIVAQGTIVTNSVGADGDSLTYQWYFGRVAVGSNTNSLALSNVTPKSNGTYTVVVSNAVGKVTSGNWVLTVIPPPSITTQPKAAKLLAGQKLSLSVAATGTKPYTNLFYQWYLGTSSVASTSNPTATNATFVISNITTDQAGNYSVVITNFGGAITSSVAAVTASADTAAPVIKVTDPSKSPANVTSSPYTLKGTATDLVAVTNLAFSLDGINFTNIATTNSWAKWTVDVPLAVGSNTVYLQAADYGGNAVTNKISVFYAKWYNLTVTNVGTGLGTFSGASNRVQFGSTYTLTAKPNPHNKFIKWVGWSGLTAASTNAIVPTTNVIKFIATNDVVLTNEIDTNLFWTAAGSYNGLIWSTNAATHANVGFVSATLTTNLTYTAKILAGGQTINTSGALDTNGTVSLNITGVGVLKLAVSNTQPPFLSGKVTDGGTNYIADFEADLAYYSKTNPATNFAGNYTIVFPTDPTLPGFDPFHSGYPTNGAAFGTINVSSNGTITFAGQTADGQTVSQSVPVGPYGDWPLFVQMYPVNRTNSTGELVGWVKFPTNLFSYGHQGYPIPTGKVAWIKSQAVSSPTNYANGVTNVSDARSSFFIPTNGWRGDTHLPGLRYGSMCFSGGGLTNIVSTSLFVDSTGKVYSYDPNFTFAIDKTGRFSGKFPYNNDSKSKVSFGGVILQQTFRYFAEFEFPVETGGFGTFSGGGSSGEVIVVFY